jgi:hypothetical protein
VQKLKYISKNNDKVTTINNQSWLSIHVYVIEQWRRFANLLNLYKIVDGIVVDSSTSLIVKNLVEYGGLKNVDIIDKLMFVLVQMELWFFVE